MTPVQKAMQDWHKAYAALNAAFPEFNRLDVGPDANKDALQQYEAETLSPLLAEIEAATTAVINAPSQSPVECLTKLQFVMSGEFVSSLHEAHFAPLRADCEALIEQASPAKSITLHFDDYTLDDLLGIWATLAEVGTIYSGPKEDEIGEKCGIIYDAFFARPAVTPTDALVKLIGLNAESLSDAGRHAPAAYKAALPHLPKYAAAYLTQCLEREAKFMKSLEEGKVDA